MEILSHENITTLSKLILECRLQFDSLAKRKQKCIFNTQGQRRHC